MLFLFYFIFLGYQCIYTVEDLDNQVYSVETQTLFIALYLGFNKSELGNHP